MTSTKPFGIAKRAVWEAYQQGKANRGAAGIDDETIAMFEQKPVEESVQTVESNVVGFVLPPPVKQVEIPKAKGGTRKLGIPTVSDRIAQTVVKRIIEPILDRSFIQIPMDIDRDDRQNRQSPSPESVVGNMTGWSSSTSRRLWKRLHTAPLFMECCKKVRMIVHHFDS